MKPNSSVWVVFYRRIPEIEWMIFDAYDTRYDALNSIARCKRTDNETSDDFEYSVFKYVAEEGKE
jgi:hypothetical protein